MMGCSGAGAFSRGYSGRFLREGRIGAFFVGIGAISRRSVSFSKRAGDGDIAGIIGLKEDDWRPFGQ